MRGVPGRLLAQTNRSRDRLANLARHSDTAIRHMLAQARGSILAQERVLQSLSYKNVLNRGYAVVRDEADRPISAASALAAGAAISIEFADGRVGAVTGENPSASYVTSQTKKRTAKAGAPDDPSKQGNLF
jgi:exodeoxyribonuclease VII large subunit